MKNMSAKSNLVLGTLALFALLFLFVVEYDKKPYRKQWYAEKLAASKLSAKAFAAIKEERMGKGIFVDVVNDPYETAIIGQEFTPITTDYGNAEAKILATNPNFAAVFIEMLKTSDLQKGDVVAAGLTGSFPGLNISFLAAAEVLGLRVIAITSVGASNWGANDPDFTWLDMETLLLDKKLISNHSVAASIGGGLDRGRGLSPYGRELILKSIARNNVQLIQEEFLTKSIEKRLRIIAEKAQQQPVKAYVNIGGGIASLGHTVNGRIIPSGLSLTLPMQNFPMRGVIVHMAQKNIPVIHMLNIDRLAQQYGIPQNPETPPLPGEGSIYSDIRYNSTTAGILLAILAIMVGLVYFLDRRNHKPGEEYVPEL
jgi:poly-gamma-glutamate system protein